MSCPFPFSRTDQRRRGRSHYGMLPRTDDDCQLHMKIAQVLSYYWKIYSANLWTALSPAPRQPCTFFCFLFLFSTIFFHFLFSVYFFPIARFILILYFAFVLRFILIKFFFWPLVDVGGDLEENGFGCQTENKANLFFCKNKKNYAK